MEEYRSGHNEAVLKTVWGQPHAGSNPVSSANTLNGRLNAFRSRCFWMRQDFRTCKVRVPEGCSQPEEIRRGAPAMRETALSCLFNFSKAQRLPFKVFLDETGFLKPARFACLRAARSPKKYAQGLPLAGNGVILSPL